MGARRIVPAAPIGGLLALALLVGCGDSTGDAVTEKDFETFEQWQAQAQGLTSQEAADRRAEETIQVDDVERELERLREEIVGRR